MSALGSLVAGVAVAVAGVALGRRLEKLNSGRKMREARHDAKAETLAKGRKRQAQPTIIDADPDPQTGTFSTRSR